MNRVLQVAGALVVILGAGCGRRENGCTRARAAGDDRATAAACEVELARTSDGRAGLTALQARVALNDTAGAERLLRQLEGTAVEASALLAVAELHERTGGDGAAARLADIEERLERGGHRSEAGSASRLQGRLAWQQSRYQEALAAFDRAVRLAQQTGERPLERKALFGAFMMLYELGDVRGAGAVLEEVSRLAADADAPTRTFLAFYQGLLAEAEDRPAAARAAFAEVLRAPPVSADMAWSCTLNLLVLSLRAGDLPAARQAHRAVEEMFARGKFHDRPDSRIARGLYTAKLQLLEGEPARALERLQALQAERPSPQWAWKMALERGRAQQALGRPDQAAAAFLESASVVESLRGDQADDFKSWVMAERREPFQALFELHASRNDAVAALEVLERIQGRTFLEAFAAQRIPAANRAEASSRVEWLRKLYPALRASPVLASAPLPFQRLRERLRDVRALAYFEGKDRLHVVAVDRGTVKLAAAAPLAEVRRLVARLLESPADDGAAEQLGAALFPAGALGPGELVYLAPSALLARVPFPALRRDGRRLVQDQVLAQIPSLDALVALRRPRAAAAQPAVILADPAGDLPEAAAEARAVAARLHPAQLALGPAATSGRLKQAGGAAVLHLALHSGVGPTGSWLGLSDRKVLGAELLDWGLSADLVVLASCASAATPDPGLWGSLVASLLASGTPSVVASLWSTGDRVSRELSERFYAEGGARDPAGALARTQRAWLAERRPVADWASFAFYGPGPTRPASLAASAAP
jgi:hypothetical protein